MATTTLPDADRQGDLLHTTGEGLLCGFGVIEIYGGQNYGAVPRPRGPGRDSPGGRTSERGSVGENGEVKSFFFSLQGKVRESFFFFPLSRPRPPLFLLSLFLLSFFLLSFLSLSLHTRRTRALALLRKTEQTHTHKALSLLLSLVKNKTQTQKKQEGEENNLSKTSLRRSGFSFAVSPQRRRGAPATAESTNPH